LSLINHVTLQEIVAHDFQYGHHSIVQYGISNMSTNLHRDGEEQEHNIGYRILVWKRLENLSHRRPTVRFEANIKTDLHCVDRSGSGCRPLLRSGTSDVEPSDSANKVLLKTSFLPYFSQ
jgi:hypothetical protein